MNPKWKAGLLHGLEILSDVSDIVLQLREKPKAQDYIAIATKTTNSWVRHSDKFKKRPFKDWVHVDLWEYKDFLFDIAQRKYDIDIIQEREEYKAISLEINGITFGWNQFPDAGVDGPYIPKGVEREVWMEALGKMIWEDIGSNACEISKKRGVSADEYSGGTTVFKVDRHEDVHESKVAHSILDRSNAFLEKGYNRSIMLYGEPGTGKSSAMRFVAKKFGRCSLRINVGDLSFLSSDDMLLAIELLKPSTLIIDDFDRAMDPNKLLTELEDFNKYVQLLMVSVNHIERLDGAVIRPGRFDDVIELNILDSEIVDKLIGNVDEEIKNRLKRLPIAYVVEFHKRCEVLGLDKALEEVVDLEKRTRNINALIAEEPISPRRRRRKGKKSSKESLKLVEVELKVGNEPE